MPSFQLWLSLLLIGMLPGFSLKNGHGTILIVHRKLIMYFFPKIKGILFRIINITFFLYPLVAVNVGRK